MYKIKKEFSFSASHQLKGLPDNHQCARLHGHNYKVIIELSSAKLDAIGFVRDYGELSAIKKYIDETLDHRHLNDVFDFNPTAENMAKFFYDYAKTLWPEVSSVAVSETDKTWSTYCAEN